MRAEYTNGEVVQTANLDGTTGVVGTVVGRQVRRSREVERIVGVVHGALGGNGRVEDSGQLGVEEMGKTGHTSEQNGVMDG